MKKITLYMIALLAVFHTACTEDFNDGVAEPQTNDKEDTQAADFTVALGSDLPDALVLGDYDEDKELQVVRITAKSEIKADASLCYRLELSDSDGFETAQPVDVISDDDNVLVTVANLNKAMKEFFGKAPVAREVYLRTYFYVTEGTSAVRYDSNILGPVWITPDNRVIESGYYLAVNIAGAAREDLIPFKHSDEDVYEDPVFTVMTEVPANSQLLIVPQSAYDLGNDFRNGQLLGAEQDQTTDYEGELVTSNPGNILIEDAGWIRVTLNMEDYIYTVEPLDVSPYMYVPGNHQGWDLPTAPALYSAAMDMVYTGYMYLNGGFKFAPERSWDGSYGVGETEGTISTAGGDINALPGFYYVKVDMTELTYELVETTWGLIGDATPGGWNDDTLMSYDLATNSWSVTTNLIPGGFKFRANNDWDINVGGSESQLVFGGDNLPVTEAGSYTITLYLSNDETSYCTIVKN